MLWRHSTYDANTKHGKFNLVFERGAGDKIQFGCEYVLQKSTNYLKSRMGGGERRGYVYMVPIGTVVPLILCTLKRVYLRELFPSLFQILVFLSFEDSSVENEEDREEKQNLIRCLSPCDLTV